MVKIGDIAPDFSLRDINEKEYSLKDFDSKNILLYFYPKDNTPGCTIEAIDFSNYKKEFENLNTVIIGVSKDSIESHKKFIDSKNLKIILLSDPSSAIQKKYGVWRPKKFMGKEFLGTVRSTFLINKSKKIIQIWDNVSAKGHALEVLDYLKKL